MSIFDRQALEQSPLADLHAIASELSIDSFRRMRKGELIEAILSRQAGTETEGAALGDQDPSDDEEAASPRRRWRRGGQGREGPGEGTERAGAAPAEAVPGEERSPEPEPAAPKPEQETVEGVVELLPGGSGFLRLHPPDPSDEDVYISSAQIKRCELVSGDRVSGPRRPPRRSERFASLLRVDTVNGHPASELADGQRFDDLPVAFPDSRFTLPEGDELLAAIARTAPIGRGSRVSIVGPAGAGKTETLRRLAHALSAGEREQLWLVLTGVRPEEIPEWQAGPVAPAAALSFAVSPDAQAQALDGVVEQVRRLVARGTHAVLLIDTLDAVAPGTARKAMGSARNVVDGGSLTVIATARAPMGGETTVIALSQPLAGSPAGAAIDPAGSWTIRRERLVG
ncbi:MAG TPA: Rho termination factor N-terminal domain-containing protein [Solirubrobacteraceae bacterium]|nr:Rho termination factor N-terminal domain-containing protein [Solirubrobacteraceae bacterium]